MLWNNWLQFNHFQQFNPSKTSNTLFAIKFNGINNNRVKSNTSFSNVNKLKSQLNYLKALNWSYSTINKVLQHTILMLNYNCHSSELGEPTLEQVNQYMSFIGLMLCHVKTCTVKVNMSQQFMYLLQCPIILFI